MAPGRKCILVIAAVICGIAAWPAGAQVGDFVSAAGRGDLTTVNALLKSGINPNAAFSGRTAIVAASMYGHLEVVKSLLAARADTESGAATATGNMSALYWSLSNGHTAVARVLVGAGANLLVRSDSGEQAIVLAARGTDPDSLAVVRAMIAARADVGSALVTAVQTGSIEIVNALLAAGAPVDRVLYGPKPPARVINLVATGAADPSQLQRDWQTLLMLAATRGRADVMRALLEAGADPDARRKDGSTALLDAVVGSHAEAVEVLLAAKADVNAKRSDGSTALTLVVPRIPSVRRVQDSGTAIVGMLREADANARGIRYEPSSPGDAGAPLVSLAPAARQIVRMLIDAGADVGARRNDGQTAEMLAAAANVRELADLLKQAAAPSAGQ